MSPKLKGLLVNAAVSISRCSQRAHPYRRSLTRAALTLWQSMGREIGLDRRGSDARQAPAISRKLIEIATAEMAPTGQPHAYTGTWNLSFTRAGGSITEYAAGRDFGIAAGLFTIEDSGCRVKLGRHGLGWKRPP